MPNGVMHWNETMTDLDRIANQILHEGEESFSDWLDAHDEQDLEMIDDTVSKLKKATTLLRRVLTEHQG